MNTKGLFNRSISVDNKKRIKLFLDEIEKKKKPNIVESKNKKPLPPAKKKGAKDEEIPKHRVKTRDDFRILSLLREPEKS
jgi:hypothetical protein